MSAWILRSSRLTGSCSIWRSLTGAVSHFSVHPPRELIGAPRSADVRAAQRDAIAWYAQHEARAEAVTAACRAWHWLETGEFAGKREALGWALARLVGT
jgi:hypothetical protein